MLIVDGHGALRACGESLARVLSCRGSELAGRPVAALLPGWDPFEHRKTEPKLRLAALGSSVCVRVACEALYLAGERWFALDIELSSAGQSACPPGEAIMVTDCFGEIRHVNRAFEAMTGFTSAELVGQTPAMLNSGAHDPRTFRELWDTILDGDTFRGVLINRRKNGELYREDKMIRPVLDARGRPALFLSSGREIPTCLSGLGERLEGCAAR